MARATLVVTPVLAFDAFRLPGIVTLALVLPVVVLAAGHLASPTARLPGLQILVIAVLSLSVLWGDDPGYSAERLRTYVPLLLATVLAGGLLSADEVLQSLRRAFVVILGSSLLVLAVDPDSRMRFPGSSEVAFHAQFPKNTYGGLLVFGLVLVLAAPRRLNFVLVPSLGVLIALNRSVTAWGVALALAGSVLVGRAVLRRLGPRSAAPVLGLAGVVAVGSVLLLVQGLSTATLTLVGKDPTLSDRTAIWAACWDQIKVAPSLGHGAFTFLNPASDSPATLAIWAHFQNYRPPHPHNGLLDVWGQVGLLGVAVFALMVLAGLRRAAEAAVTHGSRTGAVAVLGLVFILLYGLTEPAFLGPWLVLTLVCLGMADAARSEPPPVARLGHARLDRVGAGWAQ